MSKNCLILETKYYCSSGAIFNSHKTRRVNISSTSSFSRGNTDEAEQLGVEVENYYLSGMKYRGCKGCEQCHSKSDKCILKDDVKDVLEALHSADIAIFSSPVYKTGEDN